MTEPATAWAREVIELLGADGVNPYDVSAIREVAETVEKAFARERVAQLQPGDVARVAQNVTPKYIRGLKVVIEAASYKGGHTLKFAVRVHEDEEWKVAGRRFRFFSAYPNHLEPA